MPIYDYRCPKCTLEFEELVSRGETPSCPRCGDSSPEKQLSAPSAPGKSQSTVTAARRQAAREGHLSHYSRAERGKLLR